MTPSPHSGDAAGPPIKGYRDLIVWQRAMDLVVETYRLTDFLPPNEQLGLIPQLRRAAVSVPCNIAEGHGRLTGRDYARHLGYARGSVMEVETLFQITDRLDFLPSTRLVTPLSLAEETSKMLSVLIRKLGRGRTK
jgi:four helix bundle protein